MWKEILRNQNRCRCKWNWQGQYGSLHQILCDDFHVTMVINTGVAGSLNNALDIGDIVLSSCAQEHDMDVSPLGDPVGIIPRMEQSIFTADETLVSLAKSACEKANPDIHCHIGKVVSGDQFIASAEKKLFN